MRPAPVSACLAALVLGVVPPAPASAASAASTVALAPRAAGQSVDEFYAARGQQPLWLRQGQEESARQLLRYFETAKADGLNPKRYRTREIAQALRNAWGGSPAAVQRADRLLSQAFVAYVQDLRRAPNVGVIYVDAELRPQAPSARALLDAVAAAPSVPAYVAQMGWMHPYYGQYRQLLVRGDVDGSRRALVQLNMERARSLPASGRYVLVNAAAQRLFMVDNGRTVDMMRVVVGKPHQPTPMMAALIRYTSLNPYWNVPADLAAERVAPFVVKSGVGYLRQKGYQLLSDWTDRARPVNPATIDWKAVADGRKEVRLRQLPGPSNSMGDMKFMFPNAQGIYLHDTPSTELFSEASRMFSGGCVRLEAAHRLATWLHGKPLRARGAKPEQKVDLPTPVPVYLTYLTAVPSGTELAYYEDIYGRDAQRLARMRGGREVAAR